MFSFRQLDLHPDIIYLTTMAHIFTFHGLGSSKQAFLPLANEFPKHNWHMYDFAGFGERNEESVSDSPLSDSIIEFREKCESLDELIFIGHSMGSAVAIPLAQHLKHKVKAIICVESNLIGEDCGFVSRAAAESAKNGTFNEFRNKVIARARSYRSLGWLKWINDFQKVKEETLVNYANELVIISDSEQLLKSFHELRCQKLYMYGDQYLKNGNDQTPELAKKLWGVSTRYIQGTSHFLMQDDPRTCGLAIKQLLD